MNDLEPIEPTTSTEAAPAPPLPDNVVDLDTPISRGTTVIRQLTLRKPNAGELRGLSLAAVANADVSALLKLLPRITSPSITEHEAAALDLADLGACSNVVIDFLLQKKAKAAFQTA